jgi:hypothetical protein
VSIYFADTARGLPRGTKTSPAGCATAWWAGASGRHLYFDWRHREADTLDKVYPDDFRKASRPLP